MLMPDDSKCCVQGCRNNMNDSKRITFIRLPTKPSRLSQWLFTIGREDLLQKNDLDKYRVCSIHFPDAVIKKRPVKPKEVYHNAIPIFHLPRRNIETTETQDQQRPSTSSTPSEHGMVEEAMVLDNSSQNNKVDKLDTQIETIDLCSGIEKTQNQLIDLCSEDENLLEDCIQMISEWQNYVKDIHGTKQFQLYALNLYLRSSIAYRFLQKFSTLPSYKSLKNTKIYFKPSLSKDLISILSQRVKKSKDDYKYCIICLDNMKLKNHMYYDIGNDEIIGLTEHSGEKHKEMARNAYVMLLKGFIENYQQPLDYAYFSECNVDDLIKWVKDTIDKLCDAGYVVKALITPPNTLTFNLAKLLDVSVKHPYFTVGQHNVYYMFDVPQLYKNICVNLSSTDFSYENVKLVSWKYLYTTYRLDLRRKIKSIPKLTDTHLTPKPDMSIAHVMELISYEVAASISADIKRGHLPNIALQTAQFLIRLNQLYEFLNTTVKSHSNAYKRAFCGEQYQVEYLKNCLDFLRTITPIIKESNNAIEIKEFKEVFDGLETTINAILLLHSCFTKDGPLFIFTRRLNNNSIRYFFKEIYGNRSTSTKLTAIQFRRAFSKRILLYLLKNSPTTVSKEDLRDVLLFKLNLQFQSQIQSQTVLTVNTTDYRMKFPKKNLFIYICGYLLKACSDRHTCPAFTEYKYILGMNNVKETNKLLGEFQTCNAARTIQIPVPPKDFIRVMELYENIFVHVFEESVLEPRVGKKIFVILMGLDFPNPCPCFPLEYLLKLFIRLRIYYEVRFNNKKINEFKPKLLNTNISKIFFL